MIGTVPFRLSSAARSLHLQVQISFSNGSRPTHINTNNICTTRWCVSFANKLPLIFVNCCSGDEREADSPRVKVSSAVSSPSSRPSPLITGGCSKNYFPILLREAIKGVMLLSRSIHHEVMSAVWRNNATPPEHKPEKFSVREKKRTEIDVVVLGAKILQPHQQTSLIKLFQTTRGISECDKDCI